MKSELKNKAIKLRKQGFAITKIAEELGCAKSSVSLWVRNVTLTKEQKDNINKDSHLSISKSISNNFKNKRLEYQKRGAIRVHKEDNGYLAGCMLYWGEGSKSVNYVGFTNSDVNMMKMFKQFLETYFDVSSDRFSISVNYYTDLHPSDHIKQYWLDALNLEASNLKACQENNFPKSSKNLKSGKCEYGTCSLRVFDVKIVQEIYGAIQKYVGFENIKWLTGA